MVLDGAFFSLEYKMKGITLNNVLQMLRKGIVSLEIVIYLAVMFLIFRAFLVAVYQFATIKNNSTWYENTRLDFSYTISISLTMILSIEVLKLFSVRSVNQLAVVGGITLLKLTINYFVESDLHEMRENPWGISDK